MKTEYKKPVSESRKIRKPLLEKKRRDRINDSLETLKIMLLNSKPNLKDGKKLEKADILEMTVDYLRNLHRTLMRVQECNGSPAKKQDDLEIQRNVCDSTSTTQLTLVPSKTASGNFILVVPSNCNFNEDNSGQNVKVDNVWRPW
ncbi:hypothetical protein ABEB36_013344 [Hypothenemus hampei]|uniref:BHLH domain-containing protein n=1 Tax=Hypothenemus hampei TaxID=57062 RepID=A0ABD1E7P0_HYPHA